MSGDSQRRDLGWTEEWAERFAALDEANLVAGRVSLEHNHVFRVLAEDREWLAEVAGRLKHEATSSMDLPVVGDWVGLRLDERGGRSQIRRVLPRRTWLSRKMAGRTTEEQVLAANIDTVFVVFSLENAVNTRAIERYLVACRPSGASPVIVLNKADLAGDPQRCEAEARGIAAGVPVVATSSLTGHGFDRIEVWLGTGQTVALIGPSGSGKSSIVNRLVATASLPIGEVRSWDARGRHTSVHRQLVVRPQGGVIVDTPGLRELALWQAEGAIDSFDDVAALASGCRFRDCQHDREPGCAVKGAVDAGTVDQGRYASFLKLRREQADIERKRVSRARDRSGRTVAPGRPVRPGKQPPKR